MPLGSSGSSPPRRLTFIVVMTALLLSGLFLLSLLIGGSDIGAGRSLDFLLGDSTARNDPQLTMVVTELRLPRSTVAVIIGASLGVAGCLLQSVTRNPLAETGLLGVNAGAALAVVAGITWLSAQTAPAYLALALVGALAASSVVLLIASGGRLTPLRLVLAGVALSATFRGATSFLLMQESSTFDNYRFWVLGSLSGVTFNQTLWMLPVVGLGMALAILLVRPLSALALGDDVAAGLGHRPLRTRTGAVAAVTLLTGASVAICGPIAFLGLLAPHIARSLSGHRLSEQLALSAVFGTGIMLLADLAARLVIAPYEAPVSVLLALIGGPMLVFLVRSRRVLTLRTPGGAT